MRKTAGVLLLLGALLAVLRCDRVAPDRPAPPAGAATGEVGYEYAYAASATDADHNEVSLRLDWGDGEISGWSLFAAGETVEMLHTWETAGTYAVRAQADRPARWALVRPRFRRPRNWSCKG